MLFVFSNITRFQCKVPALHSSCSRYCVVGVYHTCMNTTKLRSWCVSHTYEHHDIVWLVCTTHVWTPRYCVVGVYHTRMNTLILCSWCVPHTYEHHDFMWLVCTTHVWTPWYCVVGVYHTRINIMFYLLFHVNWFTIFFLQPYIFQ